MASRLELRVVEFLRDPIPEPVAHLWTDVWPFDPADAYWWVGSREPCAWEIGHPTVSRAQFLVRPGGDGRFFVRNLGQYGTHVDGKHLKGNDEAPPQAHSSIRIGAVHLGAETVADPYLPIRIRSDRVPGAPDSSPRAPPHKQGVDAWGAWGTAEQAGPPPDANGALGMNIRWKPTLVLPRLAGQCGHGIGFCRGALAGRATERLLVAFVDDFEWFHKGADAVVRYAPDRVPVDRYFATWQREVEAVLRRRAVIGESRAGWCWTLNG